jgi:DNA-binding SARP family transcriptional activator/tetratricopeptide (TPR) repeat protein
MMKPQRLEIRLLGPLEVREAGAALDLPPSKQARALLAYLVATGRPHSRSALCDLLWKDVTDPRAGLRWALSKLRAVVDGKESPRILASGNRVGFDLEQAVVDFDRVRSAVSDRPIETPLDALAEAARAFRGDFLEDLDLPNCHEYQTWCLGMRERTRKLHLSILRSLTERLRSEDPDAALRHALMRLRLDPLSEAAYIAAIDVLGELGRVDPGVELYEQCRRMLSEDLGASPTPELIAARRRLRQRGGRSGRDPTAPAPAPESAEQHVRKTAPDELPQALAELPPPDGLPEPGPSDPPLVGRAAELAILSGLARRAETDAARTVILITGEPGIGKTRLLRELVREARSVGGWVLSGPVFETEEIRPYGPWIDLIRSLPPIARDEDLGRGLGALLTDPRLKRSDHGLAERAELFEAVARLFGTLLEARAPGLVVLDDVQWLDASSAALLHYVARTLRGSRLLIALAAREEEIEEGSAAARTVRSLKEKELLRRLPLRRLDASETASLVRALDMAADPGRIFAASEGNPLFTLAMTTSFREGATRTPATIEEELWDRLDRLDRGALALLPWAAALGRAFDVPTLAQAVDRPPAEIVQAIDHLERRGIIRATGADRYDFTHSLLRQAAYRRTSEPGRRMIHRSIAQVLDSAARAEQRSPGALAHHAELGGLGELAARSYLEAAEHSLWLFALDEAAAQVTRGFAQLEGLPDEARIPLEMGLLRVLGFRSMRDRRPADLESRVRRTTEQARRCCRLPGVVAVGHAVLMELEYQRGAFSDAARSSLRSAEAGRDSEPDTAIRALAETAACLLLLDQAPEDARRLASEAFALADQHGIEMDVLALARALLHHHDGALEDAARAFQEVIRLGRRARDRWWECPALTRMIMVELDREDAESALTRAREAEELAERFGDETEAAFARGLCGVAAAWPRTDAAPERSEAGTLEAVDDALRELRALDSLWTIGHVQAYAAEVELARGRTEAARERAEEAVRAARTINQPSLQALARSLLAQSAALEGSADRAAQHLEAREVVRPPYVLSHRARRALRRARAVATR